MKKPTLLYPRLSVDTAPVPAVGQAGGVLLTETVAVSGLGAGLAAGLSPWRKALAIHGPGKVVLDLALTLAVGRDCLADIALLRAEPGVYGRVASDATVSRTIDALAADAGPVLKAIDAARATARAAVWAAAGQHAPDHGVSAGKPRCPVCGVLAARVHSRRRQRLRDLPVAGPIEVVWIKRRWFCDEPRCRRGTFSEVTAKVPAYARSTARLCQALVTAVIVPGRAASEVARAHRVSWRLVALMLTAAADVLPPDPDQTRVRRLGVDEHRYRSVRFFRDLDGSWRRYEPWMTTLVDTDTGRVLGVVDGRDSTGVGTWRAARSQVWRDAVQVVAIDPSAAFRKALREQLSAAAVSVDAFHLVKLANDMVTAVRQRVIREQKGRRGRTIDPVWVNRRLLLRAGDTLSPPTLARLKATLRADDPTDEIGAAWSIKEQLRTLLTIGSLAQAQEEEMRLGASVLTANMPETDRLYATINAWWDAIEVLIVTGVTNARTDAANTSIKQIKRTGRGYRNAENYRARILLASAARTAA